MAESIKKIHALHTTFIPACVVYIYMCHYLNFNNLAILCKWHKVQRFTEDIYIYNA